MSDGTISAYYPLNFEGSTGKTLLVSGSNFVESSYYELVDIDSGYEPRRVSTARDASKYGLSRKSQVSEMYFEGGGDYVVQAWMVKPSHFDKNKKYPVVLMIHGGPQASWRDEWHMRVGLPKRIRKTPADHAQVESHGMGRAGIRRGLAQPYGKHRIRHRPPQEYAGFGSTQEKVEKC